MKMLLKKQKYVAIIYKVYEQNVLEFSNYFQIQKMINF